jgi:hypothetical protein
MRIRLALPHARARGPAKVKLGVRVGRGSILPSVTRKRLEIQVFMRKGDSRRKSLDLRSRITTRPLLQATAYKFGSYQCPPRKSLSPFLLRVAHSVSFRRNEAVGSKKLQRIG